MRKPVYASARVRVFCSDASIAIATYRIDAWYTEREREQKKFGTLWASRFLIFQEVQSLKAFSSNRLILNWNMQLVFVSTRINIRSEKNWRKLYNKFSSCSYWRKKFREYAVEKSLCQSIVSNLFWKHTNVWLEMFHMQLSRVVWRAKSVVTLNACKMHIKRAPRVSHMYTALCESSPVPQSLTYMDDGISNGGWYTPEDFRARLCTLARRLHLHEACIAKKKKTNTMTLRRLSRITEKSLLVFRENVAGPYPAARLTAQHFARRSCRKKLFLVTFREAPPFVSAASSGGIAKCRSWFHGGSTRDWENDIRGRIKHREENSVPVLKPQNF